MKTERETIQFLRDDLFIYWRLHHSAQLERYWENYLNQHPEQRKAFQEAIHLFDSLRDVQIDDKSSLNEVKHSLDQRIRRHQRNNIQRIYISLSAAVLLLALVTSLFLIARKTDQMAPAVASIGQVMNDSTIQLLTGAISMEIGDQSQLDLSEKENSAMIQDAVSKKEVPLQSNQNRLIVPYGKRSSIVLSDGTTVYLNSGTMMDFPSAFPENTREIRVEGEIFLEVKKEDGKPFIIHTPHSQITVYGTSFNVTSYQDEKQESVVLVSGTVKVKSGQQEVLLKPSERAVVENGTLSSSKVDVDAYTSWKNGYLKMSKTPLNEVLTKIGRYYNVAFQYPQELHLEQRSCSGKLFLSDNMDDVLLAFSRLTELRYEQNGEIIHIKP
ncbi:MAG: transrane sensor [Proteiniphilum sp.]|jgi:ferric-dicitrate binding protein FerR (iron transport regulator)|nr:transrane sensor [Proteiniphilum sp.]